MIKIIMLKANLADAYLSLPWKKWNVSIATDPEDYALNLNPNATIEAITENNILLFN